MRFRVNQEKVVEALAWLAVKQPGITPYYVAKILYFADKAHLNRYGRPVLGDRYIAMEHGPVPSLAYDLIKHDDFQAPGLLDLVSDAFDIDRTRRYPRLLPKMGRQARLGCFSRTDIECLEFAFDTYAHMPWNQLWDLSHAEAAWQDAGANDEMKFDLMIDETTAGRDTLVEQLNETADAIAL